MSSAPPAAFGDASSFLSGDGLQAAISNMVEMGFPKDQVLRAMRASFNNADRAVEYLMNVRAIPVKYNISKFIFRGSLRTLNQRRLVNQ